MIFLQILSTTACHPSTCRYLTNRMEVGKGGKVSALDEIKEKYGFEGKAIVTMEEVTEYLYNREQNGRVVINDEIKAAIDKYNEEYGCK